MKIIVIDGQGGNVGKSVIEQIIAAKISCEIVAIGTNGISTSTMIKAKPNFASTGENAIKANCQDADIIIGPIGIVVTNSLHGEISPKIVKAVGKSKAHRILLPINKCDTYIAGNTDKSISFIIEDAIKIIKKIVEDKENGQ